MQVDLNETSFNSREEMQNGGFSEVKSIMESSEKLQDDLRMLGMKIKQHEDSIKLLKTQKNKLDDNILDMQVLLGKYHSSSSPIENKDQFHLQSEHEITEQILRHEKSAAGILYQLKTHHGPQASHLSLTKDVMGAVATLGKVDDENLNRLFSEYLGVQTMLAIVCKTFEGVKALETFNKDGCIDKTSGLHGIAASIGRSLDGRFIVICLESLRSRLLYLFLIKILFIDDILNRVFYSFAASCRPYAGDFVADDPQRRLDLLKPRLPNGECPAGFLGFAVNMIHVDSSNLSFVTASGEGLRETLFYNMFSCLQVYRTRAEMVLALPCISEGAVSLDGGIIRSNGVFSLGTREEVDVRFPKTSIMSEELQSYNETEKRMKETRWQKEKLDEDIKRELALLNHAKFNFEIKKQDFVKFLAQSSSYATQHQFQAARR
ncbi:Protein DEFECTIVE IN MERISTEM SILENCING 3 [Hibiscus syriacus]|uniref:Protein DEFECTIVE IN MERISTEM SILENCING 3 n=1 Tax=Hibiscus syriacus TaxID=106335 RepID=A0A6A3C4C1_HIBSY|nr:Protein DEFECTIVE IN MERISTEM SILENCING 3 [Hibiscus syriacus]